MKKQDLKTGMCVELRNGFRYLVVRDDLQTIYYGTQLIMFIGDGFYVGTHYDDNLLSCFSPDDDIIKVWAENANNYINRDTIKFNDFDHLLWERVEFKVSEWVKLKANINSYKKDQNLIIKRINEDYILVATDTCEFWVRPHLIKKYVPSRGEFVTATKNGNAYTFLTEDVIDNKVVANKFISSNSHTDSMSFDDSFTFSPSVRSDIERVIDISKLSGYHFCEKSSNYIRLPEEMTLEEVCKELGRDIKIVK